MLTLQCLIYVTPVLVTPVLRLVDFLVLHELCDLFIFFLILESPLNEDRLQGILKSHDSQQSGEIDYELFFTAKKFINKVCFVFIQ